MNETSERVALTGGRIFNGDNIISGFAVLLTAGKIGALCPVNDIPPEFQIHDLKGGLLTPGFIDLQVNGGGGVLFNDSPSTETVQTIIDAHRPFGTTGMLPTLISDKFDKMSLAWTVVQSALKQNLPGLLGIHLEGPYLNKARKGVHDENALRPFDKGIFKLIAADSVGANMMTVAPEMLSGDMIGQLTARGLRISAGHTAASYDEIQTALHEGLSGFTHLFNAMTSMESRTPGVVGAALEDADSYCGIIVDGFHIHPATLKVAIAAKARGRMMLVTDAMPSVGAPITTFKLQGQDISVENGRCLTADGRLAGSDLDMISAVRNCVQLLDLPLAEALRMASLYPATYLGLDDRLGRIEAGYQADFAHLSDDLRVTQTWIQGKSQKH